jgi:signal transduction histidine kinase
MIVDLLDFSRLARPSLNLALTHVEEIVRNVVDELKLQENMRDVEFDVASDLPAVVADPEGLSIVFQNLIGNAAKYRRPGVPLKIRIGWQSQPRFYAFWVKDNGIGMDPDFREKAFALFQRGANTSQIPGTGVGLALVKRIVENHHGLVHIESASEAGTTVQFTIAKLSNQDN